jgi:sugar phosphate isomerase/epimerase
MRDRLAVSTWALHRALGVSHPDSPATGPRPEECHAEPALSLLELPQRLATEGYSAMELCHFHLPSRDPGYFEEFRASLASSGVTLLSLLIDDGDPADPTHGERDTEWIAGWVRLAGALGAQRARVIAGKAPHTPEGMDRSAAALARLAQVGEETGVRVTTENWYGLLSEPETVLELLDRLEGRVGLCADFGNWEGPSKYDALAGILPRAETVHAKANFVSRGLIDTVDYGVCLSVAETAGFKGPYVLVSGGAGEDVWDALRLQGKAIEAYL